MNSDTANKRIIREHEMELENADTVVEMKRYCVKGELELELEVNIEAQSIGEAERLATDRVIDEIWGDLPRSIYSNSGSFDITSVEEKQ